MVKRQSDVGMSNSLAASVLAVGAVVAFTLGVVGDRRQQAWRLPVDQNNSAAVSKLGFHKSLKIRALKWCMSALNVESILCYNYVWKLLCQKAFCSRAAF